MVDFADMGTVAKELMKYDEEFGKFIVNFYSTMDDRISYSISDIVNEYLNQQQNGYYQLQN